MAFKEERRRLFFQEQESIFLFNFPALREHPFTYNFNMIVLCLVMVGLICDDG